MHFNELGSFDVVHRQLAWPWLAIDLTHSRVAFASDTHEISTRVLSESRITEGAKFVLPPDLGLPTKKPPVTGHHGADAGVHGFAISPDGKLLAVTGIIDGKSIVLTLDEAGEVARTNLSTLADGDFIGHAVAFDRSGARIWMSAENGEKTALILIDARSHSVHGVVLSKAFPPPASHELYVHPQDDAVLLVVACGQDGTFARVAGWSDGPPIEISTALDTGSVSAGFVGFSADHSRVHFAEADELRTHAWPGLVELSSVPLADDFASSYAGAVLGARVFVDGEDRDTGDGDSVMLFDRTALVGAVLKPPFPTGMWVGRLGSDSIVTVESKGDPAHAKILRIPEPHN